jgi:hypothetical protein
MCPIYGQREQVGCVDWQSKAVSGLPFTPVTPLRATLDVVFLKPRQPPKVLDRRDDEIVMTCL